jgi:hypothetical protein
MSEIDIVGSHGAITSLYAGTAPDAGNFNGKVCFSCLRHSGCVGISNDWCEDQVKDIGNKAAA